jgi:hypothetical protein
MAHFLKFAEHDGFGRSATQSSRVVHLYDEINWTIVKTVMYVPIIDFVDAGHPALSQKYGSNASAGENAWNVKSMSREKLFSERNVRR